MWLWHFCLLWPAHSLKLNSAMRGALTYLSCCFNWAAERVNKWICQIHYSHTLVRRIVFLSLWRDAGRSLHARTELIPKASCAVSLRPADFTLSLFSFKLDRDK